MGSLLFGASRPGDSYHAEQLSIYVMPKQLQEFLDAFFPNADTVNVQSQRRNGTTPLLLAIRWERLDLIADLLAHPGIDPNQTDYQGLMPFQEAQRKGLTEVEQAIRSHPRFNAQPPYVMPQRLKNFLNSYFPSAGNVNYQSRQHNGATPLLLAIKQERQDLVEDLLVHPDISPNLPDWYKTAPMDLALKKRLEPIAELISQHPGFHYASPENDLYQRWLGKTDPKLLSPINKLNWAITSGQQELALQLLKDPNLNPNQPSAFGRLALVETIKNNNWLVFQALLNHPRINPNATSRKQELPLVEAYQMGRRQMVDALLRHPQIQPGMVLSWIIDKDDKQKFDVLFHQISALQREQPDGNAQQWVASALKQLLTGNDYYWEQIRALSNREVSVDENTLTLLLDAAEIQRDPRAKHPAVFKKNSVDLHPKSVFAEFPLIKIGDQRLEQPAFQRYVDELQIKLDTDRAWRLELKNVVHKRLDEKGDGSQLLSQMDKILFNADLQLVNDLSYALGSATAKPKERGYHPNEAEFLLMLSHPELRSREPEKTSVLTRALTSINVFHAPISDFLVKAWQDIGYLTHAFRFWRYDAQGGEDSLFAKFGFQVIQDSRENRFGRGFYYEPDFLSPLDERTRIVFRRGFLLASHPELGTALIRNSSPVFGRDLLEHPAYFSFQPMSEDEMKLFEPQDEKVLRKAGFQDVLKPGLYEGENKGRETGLEALTQELITLKTAYQDWKFNRNGFIEDLQTGEPRFTLQLSPGMTAIRDFYIHLLSEDKPLPEMALVPPKYPAFRYYATYPMNLDRLRQLSSILEDDWAVDQELIDFIQTAETRHAEVILVKPEQDHTL